MATTGSDHSCGICLDLFTDPRTLPCLHTFCRECLERELNGREALKCPVCRAKHELSKKDVALLPVDEFARQELPLSKLQNVSLATGSENCESCGRSDPPVAWCDDCKSLICKNCLAQHKMMAILRGHNVVQAEDREKKVSSKKSTRVSYCLRHPEEQLKYFCKRCQEAVCCDCLLLGHKEHKYTTVSDARGTLGEKLEALAKQVSPKKEAFETYLEKLKEVETSEMESSERMKVEVDKIFDAIVAAVEAQRNEALQTVSQRLKEIWAQKELMEVSLAQLDSFTRFTKNTGQCSTDSAYVSMATQGLKLMEQLINCHGNEDTLKHRLLAIGSLSEDGPLNIPLEGVFKLGQEPTVKLTPPEGSKFKPGEMKITISLEVGGLQISSMTHTEGCKLHVAAWRVGSRKSYIFPEVWRTGQASWEVEFPTAKRIGKYRLNYKLTGAIEKESTTVVHVHDPSSAPEGLPVSRLVQRTYTYTEYPEESAAYPEHLEKSDACREHPGESAAYPEHLGESDGYPEHPGESAAYPEHLGESDGYTEHPGESDACKEQPGYPATYPDQYLATHRVHHLFDSGHAYASAMDEYGEEKY